MSEKYKKYTARRSRPDLQPSATRKVAKSPQKRRWRGSDLARGARRDLRRGVPVRRAIARSMARSRNARRSRRREGRGGAAPRPPPGDGCLGRAEASKRGAGRKRAAGNVPVALVMPERASRAALEASSHPMVREGWRVDSSRRRGQVRARVRMTGCASEQPKNTRLLIEFSTLRATLAFLEGHGP